MFTGFQVLTDYTIGCDTDSTVSRGFQTFDYRNTLTAKHQLRLIQPREIFVWLSNPIINRLFSTSTVELYHSPGFLHH